MFFTLLFNAEYYTCVVSLQIKNKEFIILYRKVNVNLLLSNKLVGACVYLILHIHVQTYTHA